MDTAERVKVMVWFCWHEGLRKQHKQHGYLAVDQKYFRTFLISPGHHKQTQTHWVSSKHVSCHSIYCYLHSGHEFDGKKNILAFAHWLNPQ